MGKDSVELRQLRYFVAVAEELHFGNAAKRLRVVQPAVSKQVSKLEEELGVRLLERGARGSELTQVGELVLEQARKVIEHAERAVRAANRAAKGEIGRLAVGFISPATLTVLPRVIKTYKDRFPDVELDLLRMPTSVQLAALGEGQINVGFVREPTFSDARDLDALTVLREPLVIALPESHPLASEPRVSLRDLSEDPFIMFSRDLEPGLFEKYMRVFEDAGFIPRIIQETSHVQAILGFVAEGLGLMLVPASLENLGRNGIVYRPLELETLSPEVELAVVWRRSDSDPILREFLGVVEGLTFTAIPG